MLAKLFEERVQQDPERVAVQTKESTLTYAELNRQANRLAYQILAHGTQTNNSVIGLLFEHGVDMVTGTIGAVKAGQIYVPLDPTYPEDRLQYILEDSTAQWIITNNRNKMLAQRLCNALETVKILVLEEILCLEAGEAATSWDASNPNLPISGDQVAYLLYTSGSTGRPKGVIQTHENVCYYVRCYQKTVGLTADDRLTLFSAFSHDAAIVDIYSGLFSGAALLPMSIKEIHFPELAEWLVRERITVYHSVPTVYRYFLQELREGMEFPDLRYIVLGGEGVLKHDVVCFQKYFGEHTALMNLYGQSESSYNSAQIFRHATPFTKVTLGTPNDGLEFLVIGDDGAEVETLGVGEIVVLCDHVAKGYWNDPEKTERAFGESEGLGRFYRTGDLGRVFMDGSVEFMGRKDFQVKIRGYRVELGEIENQLLKHEAVKEAVVIALNDPMGNKFLVAYLSVRTETQGNEIRQYLLERIPDYMVPAYFIVLDQIPTTPNGKTDRKALEAMGVEEAEKTEYVAPVTGTEKTLATILGGILGMEKVGVMDNFFELGVHSLRAISLVAQMYQEFKVQIPLKDIFQTPTIRELARWIDSAEKSDYTAIEVVDERELYPLSSAQKRLYLLQQMDPQGMGYNMPKVVEIQGPLDLQRMEMAFRALIQRHDALRTSFHFVDGEPVQKIHSEVEFSLGTLYGRESDLARIVREFVRPFHVEQAPLFRVAVVTTESEEAGVASNILQPMTTTLDQEPSAMKGTTSRNFMLFDMHHSITDGTSMGIFFRDFVNLYAGNELPELKLQYKDFAVWQNQLVASEAFRKHEQYWLDILAGEIPVLHLPTDFPRPQVMDFAGDTLRFHVEADVTAGLNEVARQNGATLYMVLLAAYNVLLARYSGQEEILVGAPVAGRNRADLQEIMGMFVNTLVMRNAPEGEKPFRDFLGEVRDHALQAFEHQDYQFEMLVESIEIRRDLSRNPLFDVSFILQNTEVSDLNVSDLRFVGMEVASPMVKFDVSLVGYEVNGKLYFKLEYRTSLFRRETVDQMARHFVNILLDVVRQPDRKIAELEMLSPEEREALLLTWNRTAVSFPEVTMLQLFAEQVNATPDHPALLLDETTLTYRELDQAAHQVANALRAAGVRTGQIVGLIAQRSFDMLIGLFGIWKAGGAYLPIDPAYPLDRIRYMIEDSKIEVLVAQKTPEVEMVVTEIGDLRVMYLADCEDGSEEEITPMTVQPTDLAYIIYTSGSTGKPKGVMVQHRSIANTLLWRKAEYGFAVKDRVLQLFSFSFDGFLTSCITPLISGATVVLLTDEKAKDLLAIKETIAAQQITQFIVVPSLYASLLECLTPEDVATLHTVALGGEKVTPKLVEKSKTLNPAIRINNEYGPTEAAVTTTYLGDLRQDREITIGLPIANMRVYILDQHLQLVPVGVPGEIYIAGNGLAMGYWNRPELTAERFIPNPWAEGERIYRTGDLGRRRADGMIEFIGRADHQVKIRGYRIETGEIETELLTHPAVKEAIVLDRVDGSGMAYLAAYIVTDPTLNTAETAEGVDLVGDVRSFLKRNLPDYMIPAHIVQLDQMPLTPNGKLDRRALPEPDETALVRNEYVAPTSVIEAALAEIWAEVLGLEKVGVSHNFFDLGGHSLNAVKIMGLIHKRCNVAMTLRDLFQNPTVAGLASLIHRQEISIVEEIPVLPKQAHYEVSYAQKRLWYINQMNSDSAAYNMAGSGILNHPVEEEIIRRAYKRLMERHESLRTCFKMLPEGLVQIIADDVEPDLKTYDLSQYSAEEQEEKCDKIYQEIALTLFDLEQAPLFKVVIVKLNKNYTKLYCAMHHIISDGWSMEIMNRDLSTFYLEERAAYQRDQRVTEQEWDATPLTTVSSGLEPLQIQYKDFAAWQNQMLRDARKTEPLLAFWAEYFGGQLPILNIPTDFARGGLTDRASAKYRCVIPQDVQEKLKEIARQHNASLFMVLMAGFNLFLARVTGQRDILLEIPAAGRDHHALKQVIGFFINTLFVRSQVDPEERFESYLERSRRDILRVLESQIFPMEWILEEIKVKYPSVPVFFNMLNVIESSQDEMTHLESEHLTEVGESKFELVFYLREYANGIEIKCHYLTGLFKPTTIEFLLRVYLRILAGIAADPGRSVKEYGQEEKKRRVLFEDEC